MGEYFPLSPENKNAEEYNKNLSGLGGVFNSRNLQTYHYAGNNPLKYGDPSGRTVVIAGGREDKAKVDAILATINDNSTQEHIAEYNPITGGWVVKPKEGSSEEPAPVPPGDNASQEEKNAYARAKREYDRKQEFTNKLKDRINSPDLYSFVEGEENATERHTASNWGNTKSKVFTITISKDAINRAQNGNSSELEEEVTGSFSNERVRGKEEGTYRPGYKQGHQDTRTDEQKRKDALNKCLQNGTCGTSEGSMSEK